MRRPRRNGFPSDEIVFRCSGRTEYVHAGIIGIDDQGSVFQGFDGKIEDAGYRKDFDAGDCSPGDPVPLTDAERRELAEEMVARWKKWGGL
jgi:hypothetical protein